MQRRSSVPRADRANKLEAQGLSFHARDHYWREDACYRFTEAQIDELEAASAAIHRLALAAVQHVLDTGRLGQLHIPESFHEAIAASWQRRDFSLYGRLDLAYDGSGPPKLLEYNADTPTALLESAVCQWFWLQDCHPRRDQFNSLHERLIARWRELPGTGAVHVACLAGQEEDWACAAYLMDTLVQAGRAVVQLDVEDIGWDPQASQFVDLDNAPIQTLFKLYPWEWAMRDAFASKLPSARLQVVEPLWKAVLSCKGILPILWELFPGHPNLLPAYFEPGILSHYAKKPLYSREGANVELHTAGGIVQKTDGPYGSEGHVYQALHLLPEFRGHYPVIGSWLVDGQPAGICVREDASPLTTNTSHFVPHYIA